MLGKVDDVFLLLAFQLVGVGDEVFHAAVFLHQLRGRLFPYARNAWDIVGGIAPKSQNVNQLLRFLYSVAFAHFLWSPNLSRLAELGRLVEQNFVRNELSEVFVGGHHIGCKSLLFSLFRQSSNHIVGFVAFHAVNRNVESLDEPYYIRYGLAEVVGHLFAVGLVFAVFGLPLRGAGHVEGHANVGGFLVLQDFIKRVQKAHHRRGVEAFRGHPRVLVHGEERPVNQCVGIQKEEFFLCGFHLC